MDKYQTIGARFLATIIDSLLFFFLSGNPWMTTTFWGQVLLQLIGVSYYILMHYYFGQTLGKMLFKIKVLDISEQPITFFQAMLRSLPALIVLVLTINFSNPQISEGTASSNDIWVAKNLLVLITGLLSLFNLANAISLLVTEKHRALHDYIAGTIVVKK
ncbi:MAG TPA: RDD family protein [Pyrinomonadaceae bacterium]|nr:RDD family protein [Pyrinomonadaceae bacterium]